MRLEYKLLAGIGLSLALGACGDTGADAEVAKPVCDRDCLVKLTNAYVSGIETKSTAGIPFSDEVRIVENLKPIEAGEGLWADTTGAGGDFGVVVPDEVRETAGWIGMVERAGKPTVVAIRLKLDPKGSIVEAEHLYSDIDTGAPLGKSQLANLQTVRPGLLAERGMSQFFPIAKGEVQEMRQYIHYHLKDGKIENVGGALV
jgi:hypothetical protein